MGAARDADVGDIRYSRYAKRKRHLDRLWSEYIKATEVAPEIAYKMLLRYRRAESKPFLQKAQVPTMIIRRQQPKNTKTILSDQDIQDIIKDYHAGKPWDYLSKHYRISSVRLSRIVKEQTGLKDITRARKNPKKELVRKLHAEGFSVKQISEKTGQTTKYIYKALKK